MKFWLMNDNPPEKTDCLVVLSYAIENRTRPTKPTREIIKLAKRYLQKNPDAAVIMSTGDNQGVGVTNAKVMKNYALSLGIPAEKIIEEDLSKTTVENLVQSLSIIQKNKFHRVTLVLYDLHVRRTLAIAGKMGLKDISWVSVSSPGSPAYGIKKFQTFSRGSILIYEMLAYIYNKIRKEI